MSAYTTRAEIEAAMPPATVLVPSLTDDTNTGETPGLFDQICANVASDIEGMICTQYATPFAAPYPPAVVAGSRAMVLWAISERRYPGDANPYKKDRETWRDRFIEIGKGKLPLDRANVQFVARSVCVDPRVQPPHSMNIADWIVPGGVDLALLNQGRYP